MPLVADMLAAHQVIGIPSSVTSHSFCTFCNLDYDDIDITNKAEWPTKKIDETHYFAALGKEAMSEKDTKQIFDAFGLQWSLLLDLPYWDPVHYTVIDSMYALDLAFLKHTVACFFKLTSRFLVEMVPLRNCWQFKTSLLRRITPSMTV